jgi:hypothetical protein
MGKKKKEKLIGGYGDNRPDSDFNPKQLAMGIEVELEHTTSRRISKEIAKDHLTEIPNYYTRLRRMEQKAMRRTPFVILKTILFVLGAWLIIDGSYSILLQLTDDWLLQLGRILRIFIGILIIGVTLRINTHRKGSIAY